MGKGDLSREEAAAISGADLKGLYREHDFGLSLFKPLLTFFFLSPFPPCLFLSICLSSLSKRKGPDNT